MSDKNNVVFSTPITDQILLDDNKVCTAKAATTQASNCGREVANAARKNSFLSRRSERMYWAGFILFLVSMLCDGTLEIITLLCANALIASAVYTRWREMKHNVELTGGALAPSSYRRERG